MAVKTETELLDGIAVVHCAGRITLGEGATAIRTVMAELLAGRHSQIVFEISAVPYIDSSGFGELVRGFSEATRSSGALVLASPSQRIKDVLRHTRLSTVFRTFDTVEEAVAFLKAGGKPPTSAN